MFRVVWVLLCFLVMSPTSLAAIVVGNPQGQITITEVLDYQCIHCHNMQPFMTWLTAHHQAVKLRLIPVATINQASLVAAASSYVVAKNTHEFLPYHARLMSQAMSITEIMAALKETEADATHLQAQMHQAWIMREMQEGLSLLSQYHSGTPLLLVYPTNNPSKTIVFRGEPKPQMIIQAIKEVSHV